MEKGERNSRIILFLKPYFPAFHFPYLVFTSCFFAFLRGLKFFYFFLSFSVLSASLR